MSAARVLVTMNAGEPADLAHYVRERHLLALTDAGLVPVLLPGALPAEAAAQLLDLCACVYLPGGDYAPLRRGEDPGESATRAAELEMDWDPHKVAADLAVLDLAWERAVPALGVCGGMQAMALRAGSALRAETPDELRRHAEHAGPDPLDVEAGTLAEGALGAIVQINHHHRQAVADAGALTVAGRAPDGVIEAIEAPRDEHPFWLGLQWHPERLGDAAPYRALAAAAQRSFSNQ